MTLLEKQVWASVFSVTLVKLSHCLELPNVTVMAIEEADNSVMALRRKIETHDGILHVVEDLELERKGEEL